MVIDWKTPRGFSSRRVECKAEYCGVKLRIDHAQRVCGRWETWDKFSMYVNGEYRGYASTLDQAKLYCALMAGEQL